MGVSTKITHSEETEVYAMTGNQCKKQKINLQEIFGVLNPTADICPHSREPDQPRYGKR
jgi:hypothetical protein